jgi:hypothetical protein
LNDESRSDDVSRGDTIDLSALQLLKEAAHKKDLDASRIAIKIQRRVLRTTTIIDPSLFSSFEAGPGRGLCASA